MLEIDRSCTCGVLLGNANTARGKMTVVDHDLCSHGEEDATMLPMCISYHGESQSCVR